MARRAKRDELFDEQFMRRLRHLALIGRRVLGRAAGGAHRATDLGDGLEFADHREYSPGDELRYVDWNIFGRLDRLQIRLFHRHSEQQVHLLLDCSGSMATGAPSKEVFAKRCAAALAYLARVNLDHAWISPLCDSPDGSNGGAGAARHLAPTRGGRFADVLDYLADLEFGGPCDLAAAATQWARRAPTRGLAVLLTDAADLDSLRAALRPIRKASQQVVLLHICSPQDAGDVPGGPVALVDAELPVQPLRSIHDGKLQSAYRKLWADYLAHVRSAAHAVGGGCACALTSMGWEKFIISSLRLIRMATV